MVTHTAMPVRKTVSSVPVQRLHQPVTGVPHIDGLGAERGHRLPRPVTPTGYRLARVHMAGGMADGMAVLLACARLTHVIKVRLSPTDASAAAPLHTDGRREGGGQRLHQPAAGAHTPTHAARRRPWGRGLGGGPRTERDGHAVPRQHLPPQRWGRLLFLGRLKRQGKGLKEKPTYTVTIILSWGCQDDHVRIAARAPHPADAERTPT